MMIFFKDFFFITTAAFFRMFSHLAFYEVYFKSRINYSTYCHIRKLTVKLLDKSTFVKLRYMFFSFIIRGFSSLIISLLPIPQVLIPRFCCLIFL